MLQDAISISLDCWTKSCKMFSKVISNLLVVCIAINLFTLTCAITKFGIPTLPKLVSMFCWQRFMQLISESVSCLRIADLHARLSQTTTWKQRTRPRSPCVLPQPIWNNSFLLQTRQFLRLPKLVKINVVFRYKWRRHNAIINILKCCRYTTIMSTITLFKLLKEWKSWL